MDLGKKSRCYWELWGNFSPLRFLDFCSPEYIGKMGLGDLRESEVGFDVSEGTLYGEKDDLS